MSHKFTLLLFASLLFTAACGNVATPTNTVTMLPKDCKIQVNQRIPLTLDGIISPNAVINWEASDGSISFAPPGLNAMFTAPSQPTVVTISVIISSGTPSVQIPITHQCVVIDNNALSGDTVAPTDVPVIPAAATITQPTIIISEVMANPCGGIEFKKWNEYVELYNFGDHPVDVGSWWLADTGGAGSQDQLVSWSQRHPTLPLAGNLILNSTIIPQKDSH